MSQPPNERTLLGTDDAMVWAMEFCRVFNGKMISLDDTNTTSTGPVTPSVMLSWFANLAETAKLLDQRRRDERIDYSPQFDEGEPVADLVLNQDEDDEPVRLADKENFVEGFMEGRPQT